MLNSSKSAVSAYVFDVRGMVIIGYAPAPYPICFVNVTGNTEVTVTCLVSSYLYYKFFNNKCLLVTDLKCNVALTAFFNSTHSPL